MKCILRLLAGASLPADDYAPPVALGDAIERACRLQERSLLGIALSLRKSSRLVGRPSRWRSAAELPPGVAARSRATLLHRVVGRNSKQVCGRLFALNVRHGVCGSAEARIG